MSDRHWRHRAALGVVLDVALDPVDRSGEERAQQERKQYPILDGDIRGQRKEIEPDVLAVEWVIRAIGHVIKEPQEDAQLWTSPQATSTARTLAPLAVTKGHGNRWRMNSSTSGNAAMSVRFHSKSAGRYVQGDWPKRDAIDPLTHRMVAVATKTAEKTSASAAMVVQKTPK